MKVVAINSSPNKGKGSTASILNPFLDGMKEAGAEVDVIYTYETNIKPCTGEFHCWKVKPGECIHSDDMDWILPKMKKADYWVFATPLYIFNMNGTMKVLIDRIIPTMLPFARMVNGHIRHGSRKDVNKGKIVLVSSAGWYHLDNFDFLVKYFQLLDEEWDREFAGALLRPHAHALYAKKDAAAEVFQAARDAGRQLVENGEISKDKLETISRPLLPFEHYRQAAMAGFKYAEGEKPN